MSAVYPTLPKLVVKDGFDEEDLTDIDDEVFIRDGKNGSLKLDDEGGVKRPLMAPRRKYKKSHNFEAYRLSNKAICVPFCFGLMALIILLSLITLCIYIVNMIPMPMSILKHWLSNDFKDSSREPDIVPCTSLATEILWVKSLPKLMSESPLRSNDVNGDGIEDIIVGFSTGLDTMNTPEYVCATYFDGQNPCFGGILALDGKTGDTLWTHWTAHAIFSIDCGLDLTNDNIKDCIICGKGGILGAIDGSNGASIWELSVRDFSITEEWKFSNIYDARFIADMDGDDIGDIVASHTIQSREIHSSEILIISGINGNIIHRSVLPNTEQLFLAPQKLVHPDGENIFILVTSSRKESSGLYVIPQVNLLGDNLKLRKLHHNTGKGTLLPPILVDVTLDGIEDIVAAMFNSTIILYDGLTFEPIWNYTVPNSEVISMPIPGYYNDDNVPDFMVKHQIGSGFPTYYYTVATIVDGKTGKPLLERPIEDSLSREMSGLSVTVDGFGNDWFLHWSFDCLNYEGSREKYQFLRNEDLLSELSESRADLCKLRFNSTLITNLYALSQHVGPPGLSLYFSEGWKALEYNNSAYFKMNLHEDIPSVSERSTKISNEDQNRKDSFKERQMGNFNSYLKESDHDENDRFNDDYNARTKKEGQERKFGIRKGIETSKYDYDTFYGESGNDKINIQEEQSTDYEINKVREKRTNDRFNVTPISIEEEALKNRNRKKQADQKLNLGFSNKLESRLKKRESKRGSRESKLYSIHGIQKQPPTGILLPSISKSKGTTSVDFIFSTFWLPSSEASIVLVQQDLNCIHLKKMLSEKNLQHKQNDEIVKECLDERGINYEAHKETIEKENLRVSLGQMTIYRMRLECSCPEDMLPNQICKNISLDQSWPEYLGSQGNGYFKPFYKTNL